MKRFLSLLLVMVLCVSLVSFAHADDLKKVTLTILGHESEYNHKADRSDCPQYMLDWYEYVRHELLPGYEIELEFLIYEDPDDQIPLLLAANDCPEIVTTKDTSFREFYETGFFIDDLYPYLEQYGQNILKNVEPRSLKSCEVDGKLAAIPSENFYYKFPTIIRTDWLEKLGFEYKDTYTLSEIKEIWIAMATKDPDGNGKNDTFGLGTRYNGGDWTQTFMPVLGAFNGMMDHFYLDEEKGEIYFYNYSDDFRAATAWIADVYASGAIDNEVFVLNYDQALIKAAKGVSGTFSGWWNVVGNLLDAGLLEIQPEARLDYIYITSDDGLTEGVKDNGTIWKTVMVSSDCPYPEAAVAFIDFMNSENGESGGYGNPPILDENGQYTYAEGTDLNDNISRASGIVFEHINWVKEANSTDNTEKYAVGWRTAPLDNLFNNMGLRLEGYNRDFYAPMPAGEDDPAVYNTKEWQTGYRNYLNDRGAYMQANPFQKPVYTDLFYGLPITFDYMDYAVGLITQRTNWFVEFVTGERDINDDAQWAAYCTDGVSKGAQKVLDSMLVVYNDAYGTNYTAANIAK